MTLNCVRTFHATENSSHSQLKEYIYDVPLDEVWPYVLKILMEQQVEIEKNQTRAQGARYIAQGKWVLDGIKKSRIVVKGASFQQNHCRIRIYDQIQLYGKRNSTFERHLEMEC